MIDPSEVMTLRSLSSTVPCPVYRLLSLADMLVELYSGQKLSGRLASACTKEKVHFSAAPYRRLPRPNLEITPEYSRACFQVVFGRSSLPITKS